MRPVAGLSSSSVWAPGRLALPLAAAGLDVTGIDVSAAMLDRLRAKPGAEAVTLVHGDMAAGLPNGPFAVVLVAFNTFFSLTSADAAGALPGPRRRPAGAAWPVRPGGLRSRR